MNIGKAIEAIKNGCKITREGWNGKGMYVQLHRGTDFEHAIIEPFLVIKNIKNSFNTWVPSISDLLANDWIVVGESEEVDYEAKEMQLTLETLQTHADHCLANNLPLSVLIDMPGFDEPELITNPPSNIVKKMDYYRATYDENCNHKHAAGIRIIAYAL